MKKGSTEFLRALVPRKPARNGVAVFAACVAVAAGATVWLLSPPAPNVLLSPATETWIGTEGGCGDWKIIWTLTLVSANEWKGTVLQQHEGAWCKPQGLERLTANVHVYDRNGTITAEKINSSDGNNCNYGGTRQGNVISGQYHCSKNGGPFNFSLNVR